MQETYAIAAFRSRQQVLRLESALRQEGLDVRVVNTPREVALGCGLSVQFDIRDAERVLRAVRRLRPANLIGVYRVDYEGGRARLTPLQLLR